MTDKLDPQTNLQIKLVEAIAGRDPAAVNTLISMGADVRHNESYCLNDAVGQNEIEITKSLLDAGAEINNREGMCLKISIQKGYAEMFQFLLERGAEFIWDVPRGFYVEMLSRAAQKEGKPLPKTQIHSIWFVLEDAFHHLCEQMMTFITAELSESKSPPRFSVEKIAVIEKKQHALFLMGKALAEKYIQHFSWDYCLTSEVVSLRRITKYLIDETPLDQWVPYRLYNQEAKTIQYG